MVWAMDSTGLVDGGLLTPLTCVRIPIVARAVLNALALVSLVCCVVYWGYVTRVETEATQPACVEEPTGCLSPDLGRTLRTPVLPNRGPEIGDGFRGEVHPFLRPFAAVPVTARWECKDPGQAFTNAPPWMSGLFQNYKVAI